MSLDSVSYTLALTPLHTSRHARGVQRQWTPAAYAMSAMESANGGGLTLTSFEALAAGRYGFQADMKAIASLWQPGSEANHNVRALLASTEEVVARTKTFCRWWQLWRPEARAGWTTLGRFKVGQLYLCAHLCMAVMAAALERLAPVLPVRDASHARQSLIGSAPCCPYAHHDLTFTGECCKAAPDTLLTCHMSSILPAAISATASKCKILCCRTSSGTFWST